MSAVTIRHLSKETHQALKEFAILHGRSTESEIRHILEEAVYSKIRLKIGTELASFRKELGKANFKVNRDLTTIELAIFE